MCEPSQEQLWAQGYLDHVSDAWNAPAEPFLQIRRVELSVGASEHHASLQAQFESEWVVSVYDRFLTVQGAPSTAAEIDAGLPADVVPQVDIAVAPRPWSEVVAFVADCEDELQVTFVDPWCNSHMTLDPTDDDQQGVRFDFFAPLEDNPYEYAYANVYAWGSEPDRCGTNAYIID